MHITRVCLIIRDFWTHTTPRVLHFSALVNLWCMHVLFTYMPTPLGFMGEITFPPVYQKSCENYQILMEIEQTNVFLIATTKCSFEYMCLTTVSHTPHIFSGAMTPYSCLTTECNDFIFLLLCGILEN